MRGATRSNLAMFWGGWVVLYDPFGVCGCRFCKLRKYLAVESPDRDCVVFYVKILMSQLEVLIQPLVILRCNDFVDVTY